MKRIQISKRALRQLQEIYTYTYRKFGSLQADKFIAEIHAKIRSVARNPGLGQDFGRFMDGLRSVPHERHRIFYRERGDALQVLSVYSTSRNLEKLLARELARSRGP